MSNATFTPAEAAEVAAEVVPAIARHRTTRRGLLRRAAVAAAGAAGAGLLARPDPADAALSLRYGPRGIKVTITDVDILNFALNLEYLEAEFYQLAVTGVGLSAADITGVGNQGSVTGGGLVPFADATIQQYAQEIAADELAHVRYLRSVIGAKKVVARPKLDFSYPFNFAAQTAGVVDPTTGTFNPFTSNGTDGAVSADYSFLLGAFFLEDVGVTAYQGAAAYIKSPAYLGKAAGIMAVEGYHAATFRSTIFARFATDSSLAYLVRAANEFSTFRNTLSQAANGVAANDEGVFTPIGNTIGPPNIVPADAAGLTYPRTFGAVLNILYTGGYNVLAQAGGGGFFPEGLNGRIR